MEKPKDESRRQFLSSLTCFSIAAAASQLVACSQSPQPQPTLTSTPRQTAQALGEPLRIGIQGSFAVFVSNQNIIAYAPKVDGHNYYISFDDYTKCDFRNSAKDLKDYGSPNLDLSGMEPGTPPKFSTTSGPNVFNKKENLVLQRNDVTPPAPGKYLYAITLPLPTGVQSLCALKKDSGEFFVHPDGVVLDKLARLHIFEYANYNLANLKINSESLQLPSGQTYFTILSEPSDQPTTARECQNHMQRANDAIAEMINFKKPGQGIEIARSYCKATSLLASSTKKAGKKSDHKVTFFSLPPACIKALVDGTS